jgi:hypothetical protein
VIHIKPVYHALKDGIEFVAILRKEKLLRNYAYLIIQEDGLLKDISACNLFLITLSLL